MSLEQCHVSPDTVIESRLQSKDTGGIIKAKMREMDRGDRRCHLLKFEAYVFRELT